MDHVRGRSASNRMCDLRTQDMTLQYGPQRQALDSLDLYLDQKDSPFERLVRRFRRRNLLITQSPSLPRGDCFDLERLDLERLDLVRFDPARLRTLLLHVECHLRIDRTDVRG